MLLQSQSSYRFCSCLHPHAFYLFSCHNDEMSNKNPIWNMILSVKKFGVNTKMINLSKIEQRLTEWNDIRHIVLISTCHTTFCRYLITQDQGESSLSLVVDCFFEPMWLIMIQFMLQTIVMGRGKDPINEYPQWCGWILDKFHWKIATRCTSCSLYIDVSWCIYLNGSDRCVGSRSGFTTEGFFQSGQDRRILGKDGKDQQDSSIQSQSSSRSVINHAE